MDGDEAVAILTEPGSQALVVEECHDRVGQRAGIFGRNAKARAPGFDDGLCDSFDTKQDRAPTCHELEHFGGYYGFENLCFPDKHQTYIRRANEFGDARVRLSIKDDEVGE